MRPQTIELRLILGSQVNCGYDRFPGSAYDCYIGWKSQDPCLTNWTDFELPLIFTFSTSHWIEENNNNSPAYQERRVRVGVGVVSDWVLGLQGFLRVLPRQRAVRDGDLYDGVAAVELPVCARAVRQPVHSGATANTTCQNSIWERNERILYSRPSLIQNFFFYNRFFRMCEFRTVIPTQFDFFCQLVTSNSTITGMMWCRLLLWRQKQFLEWGGSECGRSETTMREPL